MMLNLSKVPASKRRSIWERIQRDHPSVASLIEDPLVQAARAAFSAEIIVELPDDFAGDDGQA